MASDLTLEALRDLLRRELAPMRAPNWMATLERLLSEMQKR